ncbi:hypothetical protein Aab01nite_31570 [Paractinoplanes abujensis]|uniref:Uncharacterized protein n=1 Tax=Paractinoplanes abujensis TaxID=882441 RepID=A0A7W7D091_9ACTN|nr:hypothetical protein [Actinoplanes abujensis]MBB4697950.1 hypothetical protein [Actinoplanes abujensis]GID19567.1 hypothetical protein Aab01nite_31570 [Actinoplanes abujensis]
MPFGIWLRRDRPEAAALHRIARRLADLLLVLVLSFLMSALAALLRRPAASRAAVRIAAGRRGRVGWPGSCTRFSPMRSCPYAWFAGSHELSSGFSLVRAKELTPREAVDRLRGSVTGTSVTWDDARAIIVTTDDHNRSYLGASGSPTER